MSDGIKEKSAEEKLREIRDELELRVKVRTAELSKANEELLREISVRRLAEELLRESEARYRAIVEDQTELVCRFTPEGKMTFVNDAYCRYFQKKREELIGKTFIPLIHKDDREKVQRNIASLTKENPVIMHEERVIMPDGSIRWQRWSNRAIFNEEGKLVEYQVVGRDITEYKEAEESLEQREKFLSNIFSSIQDGISILDTDFNIIRVNATVEKWHPHAMPLVGKKCFEVYHCRKAPCKVCPTQKTLKTGKAAYEVIAKTGENGEVVGWLDLYSFPLIDDESGKMTGVIEYVRDISAQRNTQLERDKLSEELIDSNVKLKELSLRDSHTGLYNHRYLEDVIEAEFHRAKRYAHPFTVIMVDIDYFKSINDVYGHQFGDLVLKQFAKQLGKIVRRYDIVIRFGGEEFVILSPGIERSQAMALAQRLLEVLNLCNFGNKEHKVKLKLSFGVVSFPEDKVNKGIEMVNLADKILSKTKEDGGNRVYSSWDIQSGKFSFLKPKGGKTDVKALKGKLEKLTKQANQSLVEAIFAFARTIELKDHYTGEHVESTVHYATGIAKALGLPKEETELVKDAAMLHDLGKIGISENILLKKTKLSRKEFEEIKKHPQIGADIIRPIQFLHSLIPLIFYHHERWDGRGYPSGMRGEEIPMGARIIAIADVYQALISDRPYRKAYPKGEAMKIIKKGAGSQFDPRIIAAFLKVLLKEKPFSRR